MSPLIELHAHATLVIREASAASFGELGRVLPEPINTAMPNQKKEGFNHDLENTSRDYYG
jgi:hypothetical protein